MVIENCVELTVRVLEVGVCLWKIAKTDTGCWER